MISKTSGGLVLYDITNINEPKFLIAHPGGPFFTNRDNGWWSIPKGEPEENEDIFDAALREFEEETGMIPHGPYIDLGNIIQKNGNGFTHGHLRDVGKMGEYQRVMKLLLNIPKEVERCGLFLR
jgi:predicted NUDIX family NTP pyrophosphohydrolase